jgi:hypothetical protein
MEKQGCVRDVLKALIKGGFAVKTRKGERRGSVSLPT